MQFAFKFYDDVPPGSKRSERLFFALFPTPQTSICVGRFTDRFLRENHLRDRRLRAERLHVSLHYVGDYRRLHGKHIYAATQAGNAVSMRPFEVACRFVTGFKGAPSAGGKARKRPLVLLCEGDGLFELHRILGAAMEKNGIRASDHFRPHITLSYGWKQTPVQTIEPIRFRINDFTLVHSRLWLTHYEVIERWPLRNGALSSTTGPIDIQMSGVS